MVCSHTPEQQNPRRPRDNNGIRRQNGQEHQLSGLSFLKQEGNIVSDSDGNIFSHITSFKCDVK